MGIPATLDRVEGELAILRLDDGQELDVAKSELPAGVGEGARLILTLVHSAEDEARQAEQARQLLNDLLRGKD